MAERSAIEWTDDTWNPIVGCSVHSPGCTHCYAMPMAARLERMGVPAYVGLTTPSKAGPVFNGKVALQESVLTKPLTWRKPRRVFVNSMGDLFHDAVPDEWIDRVFAVMALAPQHTFQVLTKRSARMRKYLLDADRREAIPCAKIFSAKDYDRMPGRYGDAPIEPIMPIALRWDEQRGGHVSELSPWPLPNVWLGVSAEDQTRADERIPDLLATPAAVRFVSAEPLLGPIDFNAIDFRAYMNSATDGRLGEPPEYDPIMKWPLLAPFEHWQSGYSSPGIDWIIVGGESGPNARPMRPGWARSIRDQCAAAGVPFFFKQWGEFITEGQWDGEGFDLDYAVINGPAAGDFAKGRPVRVGKRLAGRSLDGIEHNAFPEART